jgi:hypothetical protein
MPGSSPARSATAAARFRIRLAAQQGGTDGRVLLSDND